ncbi:CAP domain-containing protein [Afifella sp. JA880]|uniref:CAP domain-containing protein n=1 Tax=Afifella sp. JA880 TaxID=2975280 RepID=UPI0021BB9FB0|nr:CAP domain-containing protein [Afifella sp. JA880]MCT8267590.1 CAP domain-containing protein [Afifella sp. JA880]
MFHSALLTARAVSLALLLAFAGVFDTAAAQTPAQTAVRTPAARPNQMDALRQESLRLVNEARSEAELPPLTLSETLNQAAQAHARDMLERNYYSHDTPEGRTVMDRYQAAGGNPGRLVAENIARCRGCAVPAGRAAVEKLHEGWMQSPEHRANILRKGLTEYGFGLAENADGRRYAVQDFAGPGTPQTIASDANAGTTEPLTPEAQTELAAKLVNEARSGGKSVSADKSLVATASEMMPETLKGASLDDLRNLQTALPEETSFRRFRVVAGSCSGCGTEATDADVRFFLEQWLKNDDYRAMLLNGDLTGIGLVIAADGEGKKMAVAVLAGE